MDTANLTNDNQQADLSQVLLCTMERIGDFMQAERTTLFLYDREQDMLWSKVASGAEVDEIRVPAGTGIAGHVMNTGETINIADAYADPRFNPEVDRKSGFHTRSILCQPVVNYQGQRIGVVQVLNKQGGVFDTQDEKLLEALSSQSAIAIENSQLYDRVSKLREKEQALTQELAHKHRELQNAYVSIESNNAKLRSRLHNRKLVQRLVVAFLVVLSLGIGSWWLLGQTSYADLRAQVLARFSEQPTANDATADGEAEIIEVGTQAVDDWLRLGGKVQPISWVEVSSPLNSAITALHFRYGDNVRQGQLLLTLDTTEQQRQLREANTRLIQAEEEMDKLLNWKNSLEVLRARRELLRAQEQLTRSKRTAQETQRLFGKGIVSGNELEDSKTEVIEQERNVLAARESLQEILRNGGENKQRIARLNLENARQAVAALKQGLEKAELRSPADGIVFPTLSTGQGKNTKEDSLRVGSKVSTNMPLLAIADLSGIAIESAVPESKLLSLKPKQPAKIYVPALQGVVLHGHIAYIAGRASEGGKSSDSSGGGSSEFKVEVAVPNISLKQRQLLRIGMSATAQVKIYDNPEAVVVPFEALIVEDDEYAVQVVDADGKQERREIEIRTTLVDGVEIADGLSAGERVVLQN